MTEDFGAAKVYIHNYGPYLGEKVIIDAGEEDSISLDFQTIRQLIEDLQKIDVSYYLERDRIKEEMLKKLWKEVKQHPTIKDELMEKFQLEVMKFYKREYP